MGSNVPSVESIVILAKLQLSKIRIRGVEIDPAQALTVGGGGGGGDRETKMDYIYSIWQPFPDDRWCGKNDTWGYMVLLTSWLSTEQKLYPDFLKTLTLKYTGCNKNMFIWMTVTSNLKSAAFQPDKDVFIIFYAPWSSEFFL